MNIVRALGMLAGLVFMLGVQVAIGQEAPTLPSVVDGLATTSTFSTTVLSGATAFASISADGKTIIIDWNAAQRVAASGFNNQIARMMIAVRDKTYIDRTLSR